MLDNIEQNDDIHMTDLSQVGFIRHPLQHVQAGAAGVLRRLRRELDPADVEIARRLQQEKSVGAAQFQELSSAAIAANEFDAAREFAAQHRLGAEVVGIAVGVPAGKIILGIVGGGIKSGRFGAAEAAALALQYVASVGPEAKGVASGAAAGRARARGGSRPLCRRCRNLGCRCLQGAGLHLEYGFRRGVAPALGNLDRSAVGHGAVALMYVT